MEKYFLFVVLSFVILFIGIVGSLLHRSFMYLVFGVMILSTMYPDPTGITFFSREWFKTATWGYEITLIDLGMIILALN